MLRECGLCNDTEVHFGVSMEVMLIELKIEK